MNARLLEEASFRKQIQQEWAKWKKQRGKYPNSVTWWKNYVKKKIRYLFMAEEKERAWDDKMMERHPARTDPTKREVCQVTPVEGQNHQAT